MKFPKLPDPRTRDGIKSIVNTIVARAVSATIVMIIKNNTEPKNGFQEAEVFVGAHVIGEMVAAGAKSHVDGFIDSIADSHAEAQEEAENQIENPE